MSNFVADTIFEIKIEKQKIGINGSIEIKYYSVPKLAPYFLKTILRKNNFLKIKYQSSRLYFF